MSATKPKPERVRLSLDVSADLDRRIEEVVSKVGGSKSDVLRRTFAIYELAVEARDRGLKIALVKKQTEVATEIVIA